MFRSALFVLFAFVSSARADATFGGQVGQSDRLTNMNISADTVEGQDQVLLSNLKLTYDSTIDGAMSDSLRVAKDGLSDTCTLICREFGTASADWCPAVTPDDPETANEDLGRRLTAQSVGGRLQFRWVAEQKTMTINEIVCNIR